MNDGTIAAELIAMARADQELRARLAADGSLFGGYHAQMRALHEANAGRLLQLIRQVGWPAAERFGDEASQAAWLIAQHAISRPLVMRAARDAVAALAARNASLRAPLAYLEDRIAVCEGRPQRYGTQFDWDEGGQMSPAPIEDPTHVDERRAAVGLAPLGEKLEEVRVQFRRDAETRPKDVAAYICARDDFAREVGWRD